jgi:predicted flap endonuclease-1-like 5' DNA nuclease
MSTWSVLIIFIVVVLIVWWALIRNARTYKPDFEVHPHEDNQPVEAEHAAAVAETQTIAAPTKLVETAPTEPLRPEDLTILEGIGPKINTLLHEAGIRTFAQLALSEVSELKAILDPAGLQFIDPSTWAEQAKLAADGKFDELKTLTDSLKGGRRVK